MTTKNILRHPTPIAACLLTLLLGLTGLFVESTLAADKKAGVAVVYTAKETAEFKALAKATLDALNAGKNMEVVEKLTDLETAWDAKESVLKPKNEKTWVLIDKTLDLAISALRSTKKDPAKGKTALEELLKKLDQATKP